MHEKRVPKICKSPAASSLKVEPIVKRKKKWKEEFYKTHQGICLKTLYQVFMSSLDIKVFPSRLCIKFSYQVFVSSLCIKSLYQVFVSSLNDEMNILVKQC